MAVKRTGQVTVALDGGQLHSMAGASLQIGGVQREAEMTDQNVVIYSERSIPATVTCEMPHVAETDLEAIRGMVGKTLTFRCDNGIVYSVANAFTTSLGELTNGKVTVNFAGDPAKEV